MERADLTMSPDPDPDPGYPEVSGALGSQVHYHNDSLDAALDVLSTTDPARS